MAHGGNVSAREQNLDASSLPGGTYVLSWRESGSHENQIVTILFGAANRNIVVSR